jgi:hypothetical protein
VHWGAYRTELTRKIEERPVPSPWWSWRPWPLAGAAIAVAAILLLAINLRPPAESLLGIVGEEILAARHLDLLGHMRVIERLDLWEDLEVVQVLDSIPDTPAARS